MSVISTTVADCQATLARMASLSERTFAVTDAIIAAQEATIKSLQGRIADLEEANASRGETKVITKEQWAENFK